MREHNNLGEEGVPEYSHVTFGLLEKLPVPIRRVVQFAPYDYAVEPLFNIWVQYRGAYSDEQIAAAMAHDMADRRRRNALDLYGPTHPQAQP